MHCRCRHSRKAEFYDVAYDVLIWWCWPAGAINTGSRHVYCSIAMWTKLSTKKSSPNHRREWPWNVRYCTELLLKAISLFDKTGEEQIDLITLLERHVRRLNQYPVHKIRKLVRAPHVPTGRMRDPCFELRDLQLYNVLKHDEGVKSHCTSK